MKKYLVGVFAALAACAGLAFGAAQFGGFFAVPGVMVDAGTNPPVLAITGGATAQIGGGNAGLYTNTATTAAGTLTFPDAMPQARICDFNDETTVTNKVTQGVATDGKTVVTVVGTVGAGDRISWSCIGI